MKLTATRRIQFCAGHRVYKHESKCRNFHGHNYVAFLTAVGCFTELDALGRVVDFGVIKEKVGSWIDANWDHGFIINKEDSEGRKALAVLEQQKVFVMDGNPTAENMARYLLEVVGQNTLRGEHVALAKVVLWETENCYAEAIRADFEKLTRREPPKESP